MSELSEVKFSRTYGGAESGGYCFTDYNPAKIFAIEVRHGAWLDAINVTYADGSSMKHGGNGGSASSFNLEQDEYIVEVNLKAGHQFVEKISFRTNKERIYGPYGGSGEANLKFNFENRVLLGFTGKCSNFVNMLGFVCGSPR